MPLLGTVTEAIENQGTRILHSRGKLLEVAQMECVLCSQCCD